MNLKEKYREFKEWQLRPYQVAPLIPQEHTCATCGTTFQGNYCPRCGQSARIGRYSLKSAFLLFLDVWGLGNRSMFRSVRDLLLRPGYMIRDYLSGMQMAYFPPFKMYFLLIALSMIVDSGFNINGENRITQMIETYEQGFAETAGDEEIQAADDVPVDDVTAQKAKAAKEFQQSLINTIKNITRFVYDHLPIIVLVGLLAMSLPLYLFFCHSPGYPDFRYPEFFVAMVYISNITSIVGILLGLFCVNAMIEGVISYLYIIIALKQLSGYSFIRTFISQAIAYITLMLSLFMLVFMGIVAYGIFTGFSAMQ